MIPIDRARHNLARGRRAAADVEHLRGCLELAQQLPKAKRRASVDSLRARLQRAEAAVARYLTLADPTPTQDKEP